MTVTDDLLRAQAEAKSNPATNSISLEQIYKRWNVANVEPRVTFRQFKNWVLQGRKSARAVVGGE